MLLMKIKGVLSDFWEREVFLTIYRMYGKKYLAEVNSNNTDYFSRNIMYWLLNHKNQMGWK